MKQIKLTLLFFLLIMSFECVGQTKSPSVHKLSRQEVIVDSLLTKIDTLMMINNQLLEHLDIDLSLKNRFKLYQTENIYTFLQLDTKTGQIKQVQWSLDPGEEGSVTIMMMT